jgi:hypothetical protein
MEREMAEEPSARGGGGPLAAVAEEGEGEPAAVVSSRTMERVAAAKKFIEDYYRSQLKNMQERKDRYWNPKPGLNELETLSGQCDLDRSRVGAS